MIAIERCIGDKASVTRLRSRRSRLSRRVQVEGFGRDGHVRADPSARDFYCKR